MTSTIQADASVLGRHEPKPSSNGLKLAGIAGIASVVAFVAAGVPVLDAPGIGDSAEEIRTWFADNQSSVSFFTWLMPVAAFLLVAFGAGLRARLGRVDRTGVLARLSFAAVVAQAAAGLVGLAYWGALAQESVREAASDGVLTTLASLDTLTFYVTMNWAVAVFIGAAAVVMLRSRVMPAWLGYLGVVIALASAASGLWILSGDPENAFGALGMVGFLGTQIWVIGTSVQLLRKAN